MSGITKILLAVGALWLLRSLTNANSIKGISIKPTGVNLNTAHSTLSSIELDIPATIVNNNDHTVYFQRIEANAYVNGKFVAYANIESENLFVVQPGTPLLINFPLQVDTFNVAQEAIEVLQSVFAGNNTNGTIQILGTLYSDGFKFPINETFSINQVGINGTSFAKKIPVYRVMN